MRYDADEYVRTRVLGMEGVYIKGNVLSKEWCMSLYSHKTLTGGEF